MKTEREKSELIEKYLNNLLSPEGKSSFEKALSDDALLANEVRNHQVVNEIIIDRGLLEIKQKIKSGNYKKSTKPWTLYSFVILGSLVFIGSIYINYNSRIDISKDLAEVKKIEQVGPALVKTESSGRIVKNNSKEYSNNIVKYNNIISVASFKTKEKDEPNMAPGMLNPLSKNHLAPVIQEIVPVVIEKPVSQSQTEKQTDKVSVIEPTSSAISKAHEYLINPSMGQLLELPINEGDNCELKILDKSESIAFESIITNGFPNTWNGHLMNNSEAPMGSYTYMLIYPGGIVKHGFVTIIK